MTETTTLARDLTFGYKRADTGTAEAVWGARWIFPDDQVYNRQDAVGTEEGKARLLSWLNDGAGDQARLAANELAARGELLSGEDAEHVLYEDSVGIVLGNAQASYGYVYVAAYEKGEADV